MARCSNLISRLSCRNMIKKSEKITFAFCIITWNFGEKTVVLPLENALKQKLIVISSGFQNLYFTYLKCMIYFAYFNVIHKQ